MRYRIGSFTLLLILAATLFGQTARLDATKVVTLKYPNQVSTNVLEGWGLTVKRGGDVVVLIGPQEKIDTAEAILKQLDVPPPPPRPAPLQRNIQLTAYMIIAASNSAQGNPVPKDLESSVTQVASVFPYKSFILFDSIVMRLKENNGNQGDAGSASGVLANGAVAADSFFPRGSLYNLGIRSMHVEPDNLIQLGRFDLELQIHSGVAADGKDKYERVNLQTNIDIKEGQKIVVGKANIDGSSNALIVILTAKLLD